MATRSRSTSSRLAFGNPKPRDYQWLASITDARRHVHRGPDLQHPVRWDMPPVCDIDSLAEKDVSLVVLTSQYRRGTREGPSKERKVPFVDVVSSPRLLSETSPRAPSSPCPDVLIYSRLARNDRAERADFQAHESGQESKAAYQRRE